MDFTTLRATYGDQIKNSSAKLAFFLQDDYYTLFKIKHDKVGIELPEKLFTFPLGIVFKRNSFILSLAKEVTRKFNSFGINKHLWKEEYNEKIYLKLPQVLSVDDLNFGFVIWLTAAGISCLAFFVEVLYAWMRFNAIGLTKSTVGLILFLRLLWMRMKFYL